MNGESLLPYYTAQSGSGVGMFNTAMGKLQRQLYKGEYDIFKYAPIFESDFIQITKRGEVIDVHNRVRMVTVGIASTSPILPLPDVMLLARPATGCEQPAGQGQVTKRKSRKAAKALELTRLLPLKFVRISIHDREKQQLRLKFATGRSCYLQLCPPLNAREDLFAYWEKLIHLLRPPVDSNSSTYATPAEDMLCMPAFEEEDRRSLTAADFQGKGDQDQVSIRSLYVVSEVSGVTSAAFAGGEGTQYDSHNPTAMPDVATSHTKPTQPDKASSAGVSAGVSAGAAAGTTAGALSLAITKSAASEELSTAIAGAATMSPGGNKTKIAIAGAADMSAKSIKVALAGAADKPAECPSSTSLSPEARTITATAKVEPTSKAVAEIANDPAVAALVSTVPTEGSVREPGRRRQHVSPSRAEAHKSRRERRERREKDRALRSSRHRRVSENRHKAGGDKVFQKSSGRSSARQRDDKKEKGRGSPGGGRRVITHKGISHAPITKESRISHKSGRSSSTTSSSSTTKRLSRISSFLRNVKANLTTKAVASPHAKDVDILTKTTERKSMETSTEVTESGQGLDMADSVKPETREKVTFEAL
ncbi:Golgi-associated RAB2 interactor protein 4 [Pteropus medius]|uniref:protein FAM71A n=1 Tax=Pteropus vampyrus TaxID=132908 RepID=UPI00196A6C08|nr:protein FAM71A [Pteropus giganteus]